jgi:hypothetical protein
VRKGTNVDGLVALVDRGPVLRIDDWQARPGHDQVVGAAVILIEDDFARKSGRTISAVPRIVRIGLKFRE